MVPTKHVFPEHFFEEEDRLGFHVDCRRKEIWAIELDMLYELDRVCRKLKISYFLESGTLLGAARDGRFIPWDDDIDVSMLREDYDRFLREGPKEFEEPYFLQTGYTDPGYDRGHSQLRRSDTCAILPWELGKVSFNQGIFLDIFVLDELFPEKLERQYRKQEALLHTRQVWNHHDYHPNPVRWGVRWCRWLLYQIRYPRSARFYRQWEAIFRSSEKGEYVEGLMFYRRPEETHRIPRSWVEKTIDLPFEDGLFPAPAAYRDYLAAYYGEDWEIPENRPSEHNQKGMVIIDVDRSYRELLREMKTGEKKRP